MLCCLSVTHHKGKNKQYNLLESFSPCPDVSVVRPDLTFQPHETSPYSCLLHKASGLTPLVPLGLNRSFSPFKLQPGTSAVSTFCEEVPEYIH